MDGWTVMGYIQSILFLLLKDHLQMTDYWYQCPALNIAHIAF